MVDLKNIINEAIDPSLNIIGIKPSKEAAVMLLAIGLQESRFIDRRQLVGKPPEPTGPAKSFWQGERGGGMVQGVRMHEATRDKAKLLYKARGSQTIRPSGMLSRMMMFWLPGWLVFFSGLIPRRCRSLGM